MARPWGCWHAVCRPAILAPLALVCAGAAAAADEPVVVNGHAYGRMVDRTAAWQQYGGDLLRGFVDMYHLCIVKDPADRAYPYRGWFFGWASEMCNKSVGHGCDMVFAARTRKLTGPWEVYAGDGKWDATMTPKLWKPVITAQDTWYDQWHNGDPSVVRFDGRWYMAYSSTGFNKDGKPYGSPGDTDSDINCVMGAVSSDGIAWRRTTFPILLDPANVGAPPMQGQYFHAQGDYHRPCLRREGGTWKLWCDSFNGKGMPMLYAENRGDFMRPEEWKMVRGQGDPCYSDFPNPDVVRIRDVYLAYADPGGYPPLAPSDPAAKFDRGWATRKIAELVSLNGTDWAPVGYIERDADAQADQVPVAYLEQEGRDRWLYITYGAQVFGSYEYDRIRMKRRKVTDADLAEYRTLWRRAFPKPHAP